MHKPFDTKRRKKRVRKSRKQKLIKYYLVAYIDILAQSESLTKLKHFPQKHEELAEYKKAIMETYVFVEEFRSSFYNYLNIFKNHKTPTLPGIPPQAESILRSMKLMDVKLVFISDTVILYSPIFDDEIPCPQSGIFAVLSAMASTFFSSLAVGKPCRGGIELGPAIVLKEGDIYGYALYKAHELESKVADYPRIVVGDELINFLNVSMMVPQNIDPLLNYRATMSQVCLDLLGKDSDGKNIINYLGEGFKNYCFRETNSTQAMFPESYRFIEASMKTFENGTTDREKENMERYKKLKKYFDENSPRWKR